jgi:hypothetical protein
VAPKLPLNLFVALAGLCYSRLMCSDRAALRRATWTGGVAHSFAEAEAMDLEFWLAATPSQRVQGVTELIQDMQAIGGDSGPAPRLQRTVGGVRARRD